jgi:hypothetical protein
MTFTKLNYGGKMTERWIIIPNFKIPLGESDDYEQNFLVSAMCCMDSVQYIYRITQEKGYSYSETKLCPICGEELLCFNDKNFIDCAFSEVVACLIEQKTNLILVISDTFYTQIKDVLLAILDKHDFTQSYREIKILQSGNLSRMIIGKPTIKQLLSGTQSQKYTMKETWPGTNNKQEQSEQKVINQKSEKKPEKSDKKNPSLIIWRKQIASSAKQLIKKLKKEEREEKLARERKGSQSRNYEPSTGYKSSTTPTKWLDGSSQKVDQFFQAKPILPKPLSIPCAKLPLAPKAKKRTLKKDE